MILKGEVTFGAWLKKIVIHTSIDLLKSVKLKFTDVDENYLNVVSDDNWEVEDQVSIEEVKSPISQLPQKYELVLSLFLIEGYDHKEISSILEISEVNSRTQLLRGKKKLKEFSKQKSSFSWMKVVASIAIIVSLGIIGFYYSVTFNRAVATVSIPENLFC